MGFSVWWLVMYFSLSLPDGFLVPLEFRSPPLKSVSSEPPLPSDGVWTLTVSFQGALLMITSWRAAVGGTNLFGGQLYDAIHYDISAPPMASSQRRLHWDSDYDAKPDTLCHGIIDLPFRINGIIFQSMHPWFRETVRLNGSLPFLFSQNANGSIWRSLKIYIRYAYL